MVEAIVCVAMSILFSVIAAAWLLGSVLLKFAEEVKEINKILMAKMQSLNKEKTQSEDCDKTESNFDPKL